TDLVASLDQLEGDLPGVERVALTVGWFGSDLRAGSCSVRPGVENREKVTRPYTWRAGGADRDEAWRISRNDAGEVNYGGTPADQCVIEAIGELNNRGLAVTITPFLFMDVPPGNGLPDPYGGVEQAPFPWRGRITASDGTAAARAELSAFLGAAAPSEFEIDGQTVRFKGASSDWGYRRFILHHAWLAKAAGGVEAFLIGSEMAQLTRIRDDLGHFPFVDGLVALAEDVRSVLGPSTKISYAADWTEYGAYVPGDGSGDVLFPLDPLWGHPDVDFIGIDWYPPTGDWRQGADHLDAAAGYSGLDDPDYLLANITGGEAFDWFYADRDARDAQIRTPIMDTAHGEDWVFRQKDLIGWWTAAHHERPRGNRASLPTAWVPGSKPIRLSEIGFPAVDKGGNSPNLFYDPKSSESQLPPYSTGERDDLLQRRALVTALSYWQSQPAVEASYVWAWDARPWPAFPVRTDIWADGANWAFGHWLNGRAGLSELGRLIEHMASQGGVAIDASRVSGVVDGFATTGVTSLRARLDPILTAYGLTVVERDGGLMAQAMGDAPIRTIEDDDLVETGPRLTWPLLDKPIGALRLTYINGADDYAPATVEIRGSHASRGEVADVSLPLVLTETRAETVASALLAQANETETAHLSVPLSMGDLNAGDRIALGVAGDIWSIGELIDSGTVELSLLKPPTVDDRGFRETTLPDQVPDVLAPAIPSLEIIDGPRLSAQADAHQVALAVYGTPWARPVVAERRTSDTDFPLSIDIFEAAGVGRLLTDLEPGPADRWDNAAVIEIYIPGEALTSVGDLSALSGSGEILVQSENGWERLAYARAELIGPETYRLSRLVRGLGGSLISPAPANALCLVNDTRLVPVSMTENDRGVSAIWQTIGPAGA
ncbi:MAG: glycoside hydrolase/phage tail family protein, partial [Pseudomonadota bacterium]